LLLNQKKWKGVVYKGVRGRGCEEVAICLCSAEKQKVAQWLGTSIKIGVFTLKEALQKIPGKQLLYQRFWPPIPVLLNNLRKMFGILRIYVGFSLVKKEWEIIGGLFNIRPSLLVHGASDSFMIPVEVE
jgi:hypothetical protein